MNNVVLIPQIAERQIQSRHLNIQLKRLMLFVLFFLSNQVFSQFSVSLTAVNETCTNNGVLNWTNPTIPPGATVVYSIYKAPSNTILAN